MSQFVYKARAFLALRHYTPESRAARVALALACSLALHGVIWHTVRIEPPVPRKPPTLTAALVTRPQAPAAATFILPADPGQPSAPLPPREPPVSDEPQAVPLQGMLEVLPAPIESPLGAEDEGTLPQIVVAQPDAVFYTAGEVDRGASFITDVQPEYPEEAHFRNIEGYVDIRIFIDEAGFVRDIKVEAAEPPGFFEEAAVSAFRTAKFDPAYKDNRPVKSQKTIRISFGLIDEGA